jgi:hypothetical protein
VPLQPLPVLLQLLPVLLQLLPALRLPQHLPQAAAEP